MTELIDKTRKELAAILNQSELNVGEMLWLLPAMYVSMLREIAEQTSRETVTESVTCVAETDPVLAPCLMGGLQIVWAEHWQRQRQQEEEEEA